MGIILCEQHVRTGIVIDILEEICNKILNDESLNQDELTTVIVDYFDGEELFFSDKYLLTTKFKSGFDLKDYYKISSEEDEALIFKLIESRMGAICGKCYEEYMDRHNIKIDLWGLGKKSYNRII
jgi:hypothetical protein